MLMATFRKRTWPFCVSRSAKISKKKERFCNLSRLFRITLKAACSSKARNCEIFRLKKFHLNPEANLRDGFKKGISKTAKPYPNRKKTGFTREKQNTPKIIFGN